MSDIQPAVTVCFSIRYILTITLSAEWHTASQESSCGLLQVLFPLFGQLDCVQQAEAGQPETVSYTVWYVIQLLVYLSSQMTMMSEIGITSVYVIITSLFYLYISVHISACWQ